MPLNIRSKEKCVRCRTNPAKSAVEGLPTCETCEVLLRAEREAAMPCPACGGDMEKQLVKLVVIDKCPGCGGVWLDAGELELVREAAKQKAAARNDFATGMLLGMCMG